jgi:hypothetical protein
VALNGCFHLCLSVSIRGLIRSTAVSGLTHNLCRMWRAKAISGCF